MPASAVRRHSDDSFGSSLATLATAMGMSRLIGLIILRCRMVFLSLFFLRAFRVVLSGVTGSEQVPSPSTMSTVLELARRGVMNQYPLGSCPRFTRENWPPCPPRLVRLILYMWSAFRVLATNKTLAISGGKYFSFSPFSGPVFAIACRQSLTE